MSVTKAAERMDYILMCPKPVPSMLLQVSDGLMQKDGQRDLVWSLVEYSLHPLKCNLLPKTLEKIQQLSSTFESITIRLTQIEN